jgi:hypothetical protein
VSGFLHEQGVTQEAYSRRTRRWSKSKAPRRWRPERGLCQRIHQRTRTVRLTSTQAMLPSLSLRQRPKLVPRLRRAKERKLWVLKTRTTRTTMTLKSLRRRKVTRTFSLMRTTTSGGRRARGKGYRTKGQSKLARERSKRTPRQRLRPGARSCRLLTRCPAIAIQRYVAVQSLPSSVSVFTFVSL